MERERKIKFYSFFLFCWLPTKIKRDSSNNTVVSFHGNSIIGSRIQLNKRRLIISRRYLNITNSRMNKSICIEEREKEKRETSEKLYMYIYSSRLLINFNWFLNYLLLISIYLCVSIYKYISMSFICCVVIHLNNTHIHT